MGGQHSRSSSPQQVEAGHNGGKEPGVRICTASSNKDLQRFRRPTHELLVMLQHQLELTVPRPAEVSTQRAAHLKSGQHSAKPGPARMCTSFRLNFCSDKNHLSSAPVLIQSTVHVHVRLTVALPKWSTSPPGQDTCRWCRAVRVSYCTVPGPQCPWMRAP